ncbi:hypothetical protein W909_06510 [Dickeya zeae EC1]|nr:hypothetical protein W909_06510 [Dickeya zeae EC1]
MSMKEFNSFKDYKPLDLFFFPSGWFSLKNNMYDIDPSVIDFVEGEKKGELEDLFFGEDVFIARSEMPLSGNRLFLAVLSIGCRLFSSEADDLPSYCFYDVELNVYFGSKDKKKSIFERRVAFSNRYDAARKASGFMIAFSNHLYPDIISGVVSVDDDVSFYFNDMVS